MIMSQITKMCVCNLSHNHYRSTSKKGTKAKLTKIHKHNQSLQVRLSSQPTITHSLTAVTAAEQTTHSAVHQSSRTDIQRSPGIDELFGMDSQWLSGDEEKDDTDKQNVVTAHITIESE